MSRSIATNTMKRSFQEMFVRMIFGILAGAVLGYIGAALPVLTEGHVLTKTVFKEMMGGIFSGMAVGALIGAFFVYTSTRKRRYYYDITYIRNVYKEIFYNARSGGIRALALRKEFPEDFWRIVIKAAASLCAAYDENSSSDLTQHRATAGLAAFFRALEHHSELIAKREERDYVSICDNIHQYIPLLSMQALIAIAEGVELNEDETLKIYRFYFCQAGENLKSNHRFDICAIVLNAPRAITVVLAYCIKDFDGAMRNILQFFRDTKEKTLEYIRH